MFDRVLVALDRFDETEDVLPHVKTVACAFASHIDLVHVFEERKRLVTVDPLDWYMERGKAQAHLNYVHEELLGSQLPVEPVLLDGSAPDRILAYAQESAASLIVLKRSGHGRVARQEAEQLTPAAPLAGRVAYKVASRARQSLLVLRDGPANGRHTRAPGAYGRILVPLDGSKRAEHVLPAATALALQCQATLVLAHVVTCPQPVREYDALTNAGQQDLNSQDLGSGELGAQIVSRNHQEAGTYLSQLQSQMEVPVETRLLVSGDPIAGLHRLSREEGADLVLLSAHGYSCRKQQPYGRVAASFLYEGDASLLLIQDVPAHEIGLSPAERAAEASGHQAVKRQNTVPTISFQ